ncbi:hypothetical protein F5Y18DRAFT_138017 [Xylariaceae sp. FL1019]|nr:hypothetical protein F5Y18DRAFT_138017 [Xylariaceae sp. FL1019]
MDGYRDDQDHYTGATLTAEAAGAAHGFHPQHAQHAHRPHHPLQHRRPPQHHKYHHDDVDHEPPDHLDHLPHPYHPHPDYDHDYGGDHHYDSSLGPTTNFPPPGRSLYESHAANNHAAAHANAASTEAVGFVDPDSFCHQHTDGLMASTIPVARPVQDASLRSNGTTSSSKRPGMPSTRSHLRPAVRSVSAPVEERQPTNTVRSRPAWNSRPGHQPSVKDLKKKFDQHTAQANATPVRKSPPRAPTRDASWASASDQQRYETSASRDRSAKASANSRSTPKSKVPHDYRLSNSNPQSFASRVGKPRSSVGANSSASKSMTNLSPDPSTTSVPPVPPSRGLLFGEIVPGDINGGFAGHGIDPIPSRRISESHLQGTLGRRQRSFSHTDVEPHSPSDWYRTLRRDSSDSSNSDAKKLQSSRNHARSRSDIGSTNAIQPPSTTSTTPRTKHTIDNASTSTSRIPISVRKLNSPSSSTSPNSTRSNSPSTLRRPKAQGKSPAVNQFTNTKPYTNNAIPAPKRVHRPEAINPNSNTRLNAYISPPPPKLSPTLRSSRPRQPVSAATTTSSRMRAVERDKSPPKRDGRTSARGNEPTTRRRKISMGPIDFESRREQIKLSYTKSLRENEARAAARRAAQEKKRREAEALAARVAAAEALKHQEDELRAQFLEEEARNIQSSVDDAAEAEPLGRITATVVMESSVNVDVPSGELAISQGAESPEVHTAATHIGSHSPVDSPTLGLGIPGSFPDVANLEDDEEAPLSATSNTTEFDAETQTEPPTREQSGFEDADTTSTRDEDEVEVETTLTKSEYQSPFDDESPADQNVSIKISLDALVPAVSSPTPWEATDGPVTDHAISVSDHEDEYEPLPIRSLSYETKVTILGRDSGFAPLNNEYETPDQHIIGDRKLQGQMLRPPPPQLPNNTASGYLQENGDLSTGLSEIEEFFVGPLAKENKASERGVFGEGAGVEVHENQYDVGESRFSVESKKTLGTQQSLTVPRTSESANRISQTTVWTDYSMNSHDSSSGYELTDQDSQRPASTWQDDLAVSEIDSRRQSYNYDQSPPRIVSHSRDVSPCGTYREPEFYESQHQLPEIDTGEGFAINLLDRKTSTRVAQPSVLPHLSPDEVAHHDSISSAPPSEYYDETRPSSYARIEKDDQSLHSLDASRRVSDYSSRLESASQSIDQRSLETSDGLRSGSSHLTSQQTLVGSISVEQTSDLSAKERKRLFTRLEVIKELIDTESFFIRDMNIVEEIYKGTAEACPKLDDKTIKLIFRNTDQIIKFHSTFLVELKEGISSIYTPRSHRNMPRETSGASSRAPSLSEVSTSSTGQLNDGKDRETSLGPIFIRNIEQMKMVHETFLKNSDHAAKKLIQTQEDPTVQVWLNECNEVARELTRAWNLDSLLIKPMQRITKYPNLLIQLLHETPQDHPDRPSLEAAKVTLEDAIEEINKTKKNFELVGQIVGRKRKESDVKAGFARAFGKRVDKLQVGANREPEDPEYLKLHEKFGDDYLRLQVVLRDVEFYTRQVTDYVHEFLQYLSSMELIMRIQPSPHPEIESRWVQFNVSMRNMEKVALEEHLSQVRKQVIEPFELVIKSYSNPSLAMKKRSKRRIDYEKRIQLTRGGKKIDKQLSDLVEQYEALNEALKKELPKLSSLTEKVGNICLGNFVSIQAQWFALWKEKLKMVLDDPNVPDVSNIISSFFRDYKFQDEQINTIGIINPASKGRPSHSTSVDEAASRLRLRPAELSPRHRGLSLNSDLAPSLPTPDFMKRHSGQFAMSPSMASMSSLNQYSRDGHTPPLGYGSPRAPDFPAGSRSIAGSLVRPGTGQSHDSNTIPRKSIDSGSQSRHYSNSVQPYAYQASENQRYSGLFQSALPLSDSQERPQRPSQVSSRASSRERQPTNGYNVLWLAASLFEFNIETTKHEAGYPYLTYHAGEIFDVIAEKGELWLAKNQDDPNNLVGWLWSKHFAKLADD